MIPFGSDTPKLASALREVMMGYGEPLYPQAAQRVGADVSLGVRCKVSTSGDDKAGGWDLAEVVARHMVAQYLGDPAWWVDWAYATRRCRPLDEAWKILFDAEKHHPQVAAIQFNLGCYARKMGDLQEATRRMSSALSLVGKRPKEALDDPDLEPLWDEIAQAKNV